LVLDSLLTFYVGKDGTKRKKVRQILETIKFNEKTKEFICQSSRFPEKQYNVMYSTKSQEWFCDCEAILYKKYKTYDSPEEKYRLSRKNGCIHILACKVYNALKNNDIRI